MATLFDWVKMLLDHKWFVLLVLGWGTTAAGNVAQFLSLTEAEEMIAGTRAQVSAVARAYHDHRCE